MEFTPMIILAQKGSNIYPNTNLSITLWLKYDNKKIIYMQNNYNKYTTGNDLVPISIDKNYPKLLKDIELKVKEKDFKDVLNFIKNKYQILVNAVNGVDIDYSIMEHTYINKFKPTVIDGFFVNSLSPRHYPSLPVNLYLYCDNVDYDDERDLYTLLMDNRVDYKGGFENYVTVSIDKNNPQLVYDVELGISEEKFKRVQDFIKKHYTFLKKYTESNNMDISDIYENLSSKEPEFVESVNEYSTMKCNIEYIGKSRQGITKYYCTVHKSFAYDKLGNKLDECLWSNKEIYDNRLNIKQNEIKDVSIRYENILENVIPKIKVNNKEFNGVLEYDHSLLTYKDFGGIMLAKLNDVPLAIVKCSHCGRYHSDNGQYAYIPHRTHLCLYCGHLFRAKERNIGSELAMIYDIPKIKLKDKLLKIDNYCCVEYNMLDGNLLINNQKVNRVLYEGKELDIIEFINHILENEY